MGSIISYNNDYKTWRNTGKTGIIKQSGEDVTLYIVGWASYDYEGDSDIEMWIRDSVFNKLQSGEYHTETTKRYQHEISIIDNDGKYVEPIKHDFCY
jgi:hypothetical protein